MAEGVVQKCVGAEPATAKSKRRALIEIAVAYGLILAVIWTPRPWQRVLWLVALAAVVAMTWLAFDGLDAMGLRRKNFFRSLWAVGAALAISAVIVAIAGELHTLRLPEAPSGGLGRWAWIRPAAILFIRTYWAYTIWTFVQQFLMQCFFLSRLLRLLPNPKAAALAAAGLFALAHLPNPVLAPVTLIWGFAACMIFLRYRNLYPLVIAHAIFGITLAITIPGPVLHNMRVGLGYLTYGHRHAPAPLPEPQGPYRIH